MIQDASETYDWDLNLSEIARIWTNGCIIRSELMDTCVSQFNEGKRLLLHPDNILTLMEQKDSLAEVIGISLKNGFPLPVFSSAMNFFLGYINGESSANVLQAQRDYFGAHTYKRIDRNPTESFHTNWT
jgi:6-phosphogluconate dehydrogenase